MFGCITSIIYPPIPNLFLLCSTPPPCWNWDHDDDDICRPSSLSKYEWCGEGVSGKEEGFLSHSSYKYGIGHGFQYIVLVQNILMGAGNRVGQHNYPKHQEIQRNGGKQLESPMDCILSPLTPLFILLCTPTLRVFQTWWVRICLLWFMALLVTLRLAPYWIPSWMIWCGMAM